MSQHVKKLQVCSILQTEYKRVYMFFLFFLFLFLNGIIVYLRLQVNMHPTNYTVAISPGAPLISSVESKQKERKTWEESHRDPLNL